METVAQRGLATVKFLVDKAVSRFSVQAFATGILSSFGHNPRIEMREYGGEIQYAPDTFENASVRMTIQTGNMEVLDEMKKDDRRRLEQEMYEKVLDIQHFPTAVYESKEVVIQKMADDRLKVQADGALSFHGSTQRQPVQANLSVQGELLRIAGDFTLRQSDYGIKAVSFAAGALRLKDELKFTFDLVARRQD